MTPESWLTIVGMVLSAGIAWGVSQRGQRALEEADKQTDERLDKMDKDVWREVQKLREWRHEHEMDSSKVRLELEKESGRIREIVAVKDSKLDEVLRRLEVMDKKIDKIETREE